MYTLRFWSFDTQSYRFDFKAYPKETNTIQILLQIKKSKNNNKISATDMPFKKSRKEFLRFPKQICKEKSNVFAKFFCVCSNISINCSYFPLRWLMWHLHVKVVGKIRKKTISRLQVLSKFFGKKKIINIRKTVFWYY